MDAAPLMLAYVDRNHRYRLLNQAYQDWFGLESAELIGRHVRDVLGEAYYAKVAPKIARSRKSIRPSASRSAAASKPTSPAAVP